MRTHRTAVYEWTRLSVSTVLCERLSVARSLACTIHWKQNTFANPFYTLLAYPTYIIALAQSRSPTLSRSSGSLSLSFAISLSLALALYAMNRESASRTRPLLMYVCETEWKPKRRKGEKSPVGCHRPIGYVKILHVFGRNMVVEKQLEKWTICEFYKIEKPLADADYFSNVQWSTGLQMLKPWEALKMNAKSDQKSNRIDWKIAGHEFWLLPHFSYFQNINFVDNRKSESDQCKFCRTSQMPYLCHRAQQNWTNIAKAIENWKKIPLAKSFQNQKPHRNGISGLLYGAYICVWIWIIVIRLPYKFVRTNALFALSGSINLYDCCYLWINKSKQKLFNRT